MMAALPPAAPGPVAQAPVVRAQDAYARAVTAHDRAALEAVLAPDLTYAHASGLEQDHAAYVAAALAPGGVVGIHFRDRAVHVAGPVAYVHGVVVYDVMIDGQPQPRAARYTAIWRRVGGRWRLALWQNTALKD
jgi:ketosteroid isomerase-like protein